jgi:hypothetical protein
MLTELSIYLALTTTLAALRESLRWPIGATVVGSMTCDQARTAVVHLLSEQPRPVNMLCLALVERGLAETVRVQRLDACPVLQLRK